MSSILRPSLIGFALVCLDADQERVLRRLGQGRIAILTTGASGGALTLTQSSQGPDDRISEFYGLVGHGGCCGAPRLDANTLVGVAAAAGAPAAGEPVGDGAGQRVGESGEAALCSP